ncbi:RIP metalloprotease RseP [Pseudobdellovibrio sp. HCB154]|uniref:RIP metalloprotease RseP n=1 Tax=Pseudobdellovibrio sp. HCB154 TaxID=3386277 RepID=UPI00391715D4
MNFIMSSLGYLYANVVPFVILLGILVFVHELGHFLVARACGVRVEVFSLGFGKKILSYKKGYTTYCISIVPLGGYVKMFGEQSTDAESIAAEDRAVSYTHKSVWQRIAIVFAGPLMNFLFAILVFGFIAYTGEETRAARISEVTTGSIAEAAGLKSQDLVLSVNNTKVRSYEEFQNALNQTQNQTAQIEVQQDGEQPRTVAAQVASVDNPNIFAGTKTIGSITGVMPYTKGTLVAVRPDSDAFKAGLRTGDEITKVADRKVQSWNDLTRLTQAATSNLTVERTTNDKKETVQLTLNLPADKKIASITDLGIENTELYLEQIVPGSPAAQADLMKHDKIVSINGKPMESWENVLTTIKSYDGKDALEFKISREGTEIVKKITPLVTSQMTNLGKEDKRYTIGIMPMMNISQPELVTVSEDSLIAATVKGFDRSWDISVMTVMSFVRLFQGEVSHKNIGGMISIGKAASDAYAMGLQQFLMTMGILSISLFILNLLPVPVLDGGHLVFYAIEIVKGSPLSGRKLEIAHQIGFALLMGLMVLALFNDFTKFIFKS